MSLYRPLFTALVSVFLSILLPVCGQDFDFGDAPDSPYPTLLPGGAYHIIDPALTLGVSIDPEQNGQPNASALGDDNNGIDDEDGVQFTTSLTPGQPALVDVVSSGTAFLDAWVDFNGDGAWTTAGDQIFSSQAVSPGVNHLALLVPGTATPGIATYARFRLSSTGGLAPDGGPAPDGEVEDYLVSIEQVAEPDAEYGDAPEGALAYPATGVIGTFPTCVGVQSAGFMKHDAADAFFGPAADLEQDGNAGFCPAFTPNSYDRDECSGDMDAGLLMPDAFTIVGAAGSEYVTSCVPDTATPLGPACGAAAWGANIDLTVTNGTGFDCYLNVVMDWNQDGAWGGTSSCAVAAAPEHVLVNFLVPNGFGGPLSVLQPPGFLVGPNTGYVWTRFSITESSVPTDWDGSGNYEQGETEDYLLLVGESTPPEPGIKWVQWPDCENGMDVASWRLYQAQEESGPTLADDWLCDGRPVSGLEWWGSYMGWMEEVPSPDTPPPDPALRPMGFFLTWYTDVPTNGTPFSHPGAVLFTNYYAIEEYGQSEVVPGIVFETYYCVTPRYDLPGFFEHEYRYHLDLPETEEWLEKEGNVYWVSIEAVYPEAPAVFPWGWKTTTPQWHWNDDAVYREMATWLPMVYPPPDWPPGHPYDGQTVDLAFALLTDVMPGRCKKWAQPPDMIEGEDLNSTDYVSMPHRADDFISDGRPITDIHWWGSYIDWQPQTVGSETNPVAPPTGAYHPLGFQLSWHAEDPENACLPGAVLTNIFVNITNCHEVYYGPVFQFWKDPPVYEHEYQYYVDLLDPELAESGAWLETNGGHYWLDIVASFPGNFDPGGEHNGWGWKITPAVTSCPSVFSPGGVSPWTEDVLPPPHPRMNQVFDLAFELTTVEPDTNTVIVLDDMYGPQLDRHTVVSRGYCGCGRQVLQASTNLPSGEVGWADLLTNAYPRQLNNWVVDPDRPLKCYRVKAVK